MNYLSPSDYENYGLEPTVPMALVSAASSLIDAHCGRTTLSLARYTERLRVSGTGRVRLTYLPLVPIVAETSPTGTTPFASVRARYAAVRGGTDELAAAVSQAFGMPGSWVSLTPSTVDYCAQTGELVLPANALGVPFAEVEVNYQAGYGTLPDRVKVACAQIVKNAMATPALNIRANSIDRMHMQYFSDTLLDSTVRTLLSAYVAQKVG